jgi:hypothetical protein
MENKTMQLKKVVAQVWRSILPLAFRVLGKRGQMKCLCCGNGLEELELLVKNGKKLTRQWLSYRGAGQVGYTGRKR